MMKKQKQLLLSKISAIYGQFKKKTQQQNWLFNVWTLTSEVVHPCCCSRYTQCLCLHLSPKCKAHAGRDELQTNYGQLQTNNGDVGMCLYYDCVMGHCDDCPDPSVLKSFLRDELNNQFR